MSENVDVLAVIDHCRPYVKSKAGFLEVKSYDEARAAVADLIEAATRLHDRAEFEGFGRDASAEMDAVNTALARVKGSAE